MKRFLTISALAIALASPLAGCRRGDVAVGVGAAAIGIGAIALGNGYYNNHCYANSYDYYCRDNWSGWYGRPWYRGYGLEADQNLTQKQSAHLANKEVIAGGLRLRYGISKAAASRLGNAFAGAREGKLAAAYRIGFRDADFEQIAQGEDLAPSRLNAIASGARVSPAIAAEILSDLSEQALAN